ncbi:hypothetical protein [Congregibacter sp.]|uniref:hypothetical protein n=1 Tax=Congregibacter sp. TaxID=2744308 RepID=UPI003F6D7182
MPWPDPVSLEGEFASLIPLQAEHADALALASDDGEVWRAWYTNVPAPADVAAEMARIGAKADGILRNHSRHHNGTLRDTCAYSILDSEWAGVKAADYMLGFDAQ